MKLINKGVILILILLSASHVSFSKEITNLHKRIKYGKTNSRKNFKFKAFSKNASSNKFIRTMVSNKSFRDWFNIDYLLPIAFLKGVFSQFESTEDIEKYLGYILDPINAPRDIMCNYLKKKIVDKTFGKDDDNEKKKDNFINNQVQEFKADELLSQKNILTLFANSYAEEKDNFVNISNLCNNNNDLSIYNNGVDKIIEFIKNKLEKDEFIKNNISLKKQTLSSFFSFDGFDRYELNMFTEFEDIKDNISSLRDDLVEEIKFVHLNCFKQYALDKILEANETIYYLTDDDVNSIFYDRKKVESNNFKIDLKSMTKIENYLYLDGLNISKKCLNTVLKFYQDKKKDLNTMQTNSTKCNTEVMNNYDGFSYFVSKLFWYAVKFIKELIVCIKDSLLAQITTIAISSIVKSLLSFFTGWSTFKFIWYLGKSIYYLISALNVDDYNKKYKREKAEKLGISIGSLINGLKGWFGMGKRRFKKLSKRMKNK